MGKSTPSPRKFPSSFENPTISVDLQQEAYTETVLVERPNDLPRDIQLAEARQALGASTSGSVQPRVVNEGVSSTIIGGSNGLLLDDGLLLDGASLGGARLSGSSSGSLNLGSNVISAANRDSYYGRW